MSNKTRSGAPIAFTTLTAGTPGTSPRVLTFPSYARPVYVCNLSGQPVTVKFGATNASATSGHVVIADDGHHVTPAELNVTTMSLYLASGDYDDVIVEGWPPR